MDFSPVFVSLAKGLKESVAADAVNPDAGTLILQNFDVKQTEELVPRDGSPAIGNLDIQGAPAPVPTAWRLATRGNTLVRLSQYGATSSLYAYSPSRDRWIPASATIAGPTAYDLTTVVGGSIAAHSSAYLPGYVALGFVNATGEAEARIVDETTGVTIWTSAFTSSSGQTARCRVLACNGLFVWLADDMNNQEIDGYVVDPVVLIPAFAQVSSTASHPWQTSLDAIVVGNTIHVAFATQAGGVQGITITPAAGSLAHVNYGITTAALVPIATPECMSFVRDLGGSGKIGLVSVDLSNGVMVHWDINATGTPAGSFFMETVQSRAHHTLNVTACTTSAAAGGDVQVIAEFHPSDLFLATCAGALAGSWLSAGAGIGATLTAPSTGVVTVDAHALALGDVVLVTNVTTTGGATASKYGLYRVSTAGAVGVTCVLTRATNFDTASEITRDALVRVSAGGFANAQYHVAKVLDSENSPTTFAPGTFTLDSSALAIAFFDPAATPVSQPITQYRRYDRYLWTSFKSSSNVVTSAQWTRGLGLTSHIYTHGGARFVLANYDNGGEPIHQGSYFLLQCPATIASGPATPQAALAVDFEAGIQPDGHLQDVAINQDGNALGALLIRANAVAIDDGVRAIQLAEITLNPPVGHMLEADGSLFVPGGVLGQYDGKNYFPALFPYAPDGLSAVPSATVGGLGTLAPGIVNKTGTTPPDVTIDGTATTPTVVWILVTTGVTFAGGATSAGRFKYSTDRGATFVTGQIIADSVPIGATGFTAHFTPGTYAVDNVYKTTSETVYRLAVVFRCTDANGRAQRSTPSFFDVVLYAGQSAINVEWLPIYHFADKPNPFVEIYRSPANLPEQLNLNIFGPSDPTIASSAATIIQDDPLIARAPLLYTSGGVEAHVPAGGISDLCLHSNRIFAVSMDDPTKLLVTTPLADGEIPGFTDSGAIQVPAVTHAVANFLDNLVVFSEDATRIQAPSDGPNSQGQGAWPQLQPIEGGTTTTQPLTVCATPDGLGFCSKNAGEGYQVVTRSLTINPVGIDVQAQLSASTVIDTIYVPKKSQTRLYLANSAVLVWDHLHQQWGTYNAIPSAAVAVWNGKPVYFTNFGNPVFDACRVETPGTYLEGLSTLVFQVESPWIQLAVLKGTPYPNIGGYERVRRCIGVGRKLSSTPNDLTVQIFADGNAATPVAQYVETAATPQTDWAWRIRSVGKFSRLKIRVTTSNDQGQPPAAIRGVTMEIGGKVGLQRFGRNIAAS